MYPHIVTWMIIEVQPNPTEMMQHFRQQEKWNHIT